MTTPRPDRTLPRVAAYGVVGASPHRHKYGNKVLRCYQQNGRRAIPVNPNESDVRALPAWQACSTCPDDVQSISVITPRGHRTCRGAGDSQGIQHVWMQPGRRGQGRLARPRGSTDCGRQLRAGSARLS